MIPRAIAIKNSLEKNKVVIVYGPRQVGKTTLLKDFLSRTNLKYKLFTGDQIDFANNFGKCDLGFIKKLLGDAKLLVIDEA